MADDKKNPLGPTGDQVRSNVERIREARGLTKKDLSERVAMMGRSIPPLGISRIEAGARRVDADDLVALAVALDVNVSTLLLPPKTTGEMDLTAAGTVTASAAWDWADGKRPLRVPEDDDGTALVEFQRNARPPGRRSWAVTTPAGMLQAAIEQGAPPEKIRELREVFGYTENQPGQGD